MCGIVGIYRQEGVSEGDRQAVDSALRVLEARGPDGSGCHVTESVLLGHRRLAILDPAKGGQPWLDAASGTVLSYNGELYNGPELRRTLVGRGHAIRTDCDTELLMAAYLEWGEGCVGRLEGMFAFAVLDPRRERLWLVRDRLGVKPLYYAAGRRCFVFASSLAALFAFREVEPVLDPVGLSHYLLTIRTSLAGRTLIRGVSTLQPGEALRLDLRDGSVVTNRYWELPVIGEADKGPGPDSEAAVARVRELFDGAVQRQLISDVPLGGFLSGGIDSSILAGSVMQGRGTPLHAYSTGYRRDGYNEWDFVRMTTGLHGIALEEVVLDEADYPADWRALVRAKGLPLSTPNEVPIMRLARTFRERFTVAMTGEGADELFGGYTGPTFTAFDHDRAQGAHGGVAGAALVRAYGTARLGSRREHFFRVNSWIGEAAQAGLLREEVLGGGTVSASIMAVYDDLFERFRPCSTLSAYLHVHARVNLEGLLNRLDSSTMAASVEGRVPFTDHHLAEWVSGLPDRFKLGLQAGLPQERLRHLSARELEANGWVESKRLLRQAFADRVPASILHRPKMSFPVPFLEWFQGPWEADYRQALQESPLLAALLREDRRVQLLEPSSPVDGMLAWPLMNLAIMEECWGLRV